MSFRFPPLLLPNACAPVCVRSCVFAFVCLCGCTRDLHHRRRHTTLRPQPVEFPFSGWKHLSASSSAAIILMICAGAGVGYDIRTHPNGHPTWSRMFYKLHIPIFVYTCYWTLCSYIILYLSYSLQYYNIIYIYDDTFMSIILILWIHNISWQYKYK